MTDDQNKNNNNPTYKDLYDLVDSRTASMDNKIQHLSQRFDTLEAGRLSAIETKYAQMNTDFQTELSKIRANQAIANNKVLVIWSMIIIGINIIAAYAIKLITK